jgi:hypothetical protein
MKNARRSLRRAVGLSCSLASDTWDGALKLFASDVSYEGLWIDTLSPLEPGAEVVLAFAPPGARASEDVWAIAEVARVAGLGEETWTPGMGLAFTYLNSVDQRFLMRSLIGRPPRLPRRRSLPPPLPVRLPSRQLSGEPSASDLDFEFEFLALGELLTASGPRAFTTGSWPEDRRYAQLSPLRK